MRSGPVCAPAVDFDDELLLTPEEVHLAAIDRDVHFRLGKAVAAAERDHELLEVGAGAIRVEPGVEGQTEELRLAEGCGELGLGKDRL
jgi:hypothetical protein